jgi:hypothetical protein
MAGAAWYVDGTVTVTQGSATVIGVGTYWITQVKVGDAFALLSGGGVSKFYEVSGVIDNTHLELKNAYAEEGAIGRPYAVIRNFSGTWSMTEQIAADLSAHIREFRILLERNLKGDKGDPGKDGNSILSGTGSPSANLGVDGDWYIDSATTGFYRREGAAWILRAMLKGEKGDAGTAGSVWLFSVSDPLVSAGLMNDYHLNTVSGDVFRRETSGWTKIGNIRGPRGLQGEPGIQGNPGPKGDAGAAGSKWHSSSGAPSGALGADGDWCVNIAVSGNGDVYQKLSGAWVLKGNMRGPQGLQGLKGDPGINWRGSYSPIVDYIPGDGMTNGGSSYLCLAPCKGAAPSEGGDSNWLLLARKGLDGTGAGDMSKADYDPDGDGKVSSAAHADTATTATSANNAARAAAADTADKVDWEGVMNQPPTYPPSLHGMGSHTPFTLAELNSKLSDADLTPFPTIGAADGLKVIRAKEDKTGYELAEIKGGGALVLTLAHSSEDKSTTSATYEDLYSGSIIARSAWHSATFLALVQRSGAGQVRVTVTDGTHTAQVEGAAFTAEGQDALVLDCSTLNDNAVWTITVAALTSGGSATISRIKITADPVDAFSPPFVASGTGGSTNTTTWAELASASVLPTALQPDGLSGVILSGAATLTGATGAEVRVTVSGTVGATTTSETATATITASGVFRLDCRYPAIAAATMAVRIDGRVTAGTGTLALPTWQLNIEQ